MSNDKVSENIGGGDCGDLNRPWALLYCSTSSTLNAPLPVSLKYFKVSSSVGKNPIVAPYSGAIFAIVALSATGKLDKPSPKKSTNLPTTP